ncbi:hypothetical protein KM043_010161 [Ampulex compressa]|nr:hypothetical protein KM043_010161 [Ampulex compressa]
MRTATLASSPQPSFGALGKSQIREGSSARCATFVERQFGEALEAPASKGRVEGFPDFRAGGKAARDSANRISIAPTSMPGNFRCETPLSLFRISREARNARPRVEGGEGRKARGVRGWELLEPHPPEYWDLSGLVEVVIFAGYCWKIGPRHLYGAVGMIEVLVL